MTRAVVEHSRTRGEQLQRPKLQKYWCMQALRRLVWWSVPSRVRGTWQQRWSPNA